MVVSHKAAEWDPGQYLRFSDYRLRPAIELLQRVQLDAPALIVDLGCGTGNVTQLLAKRWPEAEVHAVDNSAQMLAQARALPGAVRWVETDIRHWSAQRPADLIYSNAALHWLKGHSELFSRLVGCLAQGGCLAAQMPLSWDLPSHQLLRETLANGGQDGGPLGDAMLRDAVDRKWVAAPEFYYDLLSRWMDSVDVWQTEYLHELSGEDPIFEWVQGSALRPVLNVLSGEQRAAFLEQYRRRLRKAYPANDKGVTLYPFRRLFMVAYKRRSFA